MSRSINGITKEAAAEITKLFGIVHDNEKLTSYLMSDSYRETRDPNDFSTYWSLRHEWADAIIRLNEKFGIALPTLESALKKIDFYEDNKYSERERNAEKLLEQLAL